VKFTGLFFDSLLPNLVFHLASITVFVVFCCMLFNLAHFLMFFVLVFICGFFVDYHSLHFWVIIHILVTFCYCLLLLLIHIFKWADNDG